MQKEAEMFCFQCQETLKGSGCTTFGVCGKSPELCHLQDLLTYLLKGFCALGAHTELNHKLICENLFATITNANFDNADFVKRIKEIIKLRNDLLQKIKLSELSKDYYEVLTWSGDSYNELVEKGKQVGVLSCPNENIRSLRELIVYGLKGMAAYLYHAAHLKHEDKELYKFLEQTLAQTLDESQSFEDLLALSLKVGEQGVKAMALLDQANTSAYGHPEISKVNLGVGSRPGILVSGHDLKDLELLLEQSQDSGIDIYTHSEMLPAHYYPAFKKYKHFVGNYGGAWWQQTKDFETFNGPILFTTNCIVPPKSHASYKDKVYTTGATGFAGFKHITTKENGFKDFSEIIEQAKTCKPPIQIEEGEIIGGFAHNQVMQLAGKVVEAVQNKSIRQFYVMAGCDGRMSEREYYTEFAEGLPQDTVILTAGCAKYRFNKLALGDINGIPRVLDAGQCNDSYSLAVIALKLKEAFGLENINDLPIVYNISWYEQKAAIVLLALLHLGIKNITLGPTLPAFLSPKVAEILINSFGINSIGSVHSDLERFNARVPVAAKNISD